VLALIENPCSNYSTVSVVQGNWQPERIGHMGYPQHSAQ